MSPAVQLKDAGVADICTRPASLIRASSCCCERRLGLDSRLPFPLSASKLPLLRGFTSDCWPRLIARWLLLPLLPQEALHLLAEDGALGSPALPKPGRAGGWVTGAATRHRIMAATTSESSRLDSTSLCYRLALHKGEIRDGLSWNDGSVLESRSSTEKPDGPWWAEAFSAAL